MDYMDLTISENKAIYNQIQNYCWKSLGLKYLLCALQKLGKSMV